MVTNMDMLNPWDEGDERDWLHDKLDELINEEDSIIGKIPYVEDQLFYWMADKIMAEQFMGLMTAIVYPEMRCGCVVAWIYGDIQYGFRLMGCVIHDRPRLIFTNN